MSKIDIAIENALDMFKEAAIRLLDGSDTTEYIMKHMSDETKELVDVFVKNRSASALLLALYYIEGDIEGIFDEHKQMKLRVALYGTRVEDIA